jgi:hypothetical protein
MAMEMVTRLKREVMDGRKIFDNYISVKELITRIYKELKKSNCKESITQ